MFSIIIFLVSLYQSTLSNGMRVVLLEDHSSPITSAKIFVDVGSIYEGVNQGMGLSHFCEHIVSGGTSQYRTEEQYSETDRSIGSYSNAYTSWERTVYLQTAPSKYTDSIIQMLMEQVFTCQFDSFEVKREHGVITQEILIDETPDERVWRALFSFMLGNHPLNVPILGFKDAMNSITRDIVYDFYLQRYTPPNTVLIVVGDFDTEKTIEFIKNQSEKFPAKSYLPSTVSQTPQYNYYRADTIYEDVAASDITLLWNGVQSLTDDELTLDLLANYLSGGESALLNKILVEKEKIAVSSSSWNYSLRRCSGLFAIDVVTENPDNFSKIEEIVLSEIKKIADGNIDEERLARVKNLIKYNRLRDRTVSGKSELIGQGMLIANDPFYFDRYTVRIMKVSSNDLQKAAIKFLNPDKRQVFYAIPLQYENIDTNEVIEVAGLIPFEKIEIPNFPTLLYQKTPGEFFISLRISFGGGSKIEKPGSEGCGEFLLNLILRKTTFISEERLNETLDNLGITKNSRAGRDIYSINLEIPIENFVEAMKLLGKSLKNIDFSDQALFDIKREMIVSIESLEKNPNYLHNVFYSSHFFPIGSYNRFMTTNSIENITAENLKNLLVKVMIKGNVIISISGDIDPINVENLIKNNMPELQEGSSLVYLDEILTNFPENDSQIYEFQQTFITLLFPTVNWQHADFPALTLITELFANSDFRLHKALRGDEDLVYWGFGYQLNYGAFSCFVFNSQTNLENEVRVKEVYTEQIEKIKNELMSNIELENAKNAIFASFTMMNERASSRASTASNCYLRGLPINFYNNEFIEKVNALTPEDIKKVANKYFIDGSWYISKPSE